MEYAALDVLRAASITILNLFALPLLGGWALHKIASSLIKILMEG